MRRILLILLLPVLLRFHDGHAGEGTAFPDALTVHGTVLEGLEVTQAYLIA